MRGSKALLFPDCFCTPVSDRPFIQSNPGGGSLSWYFISSREGDEGDTDPPTVLLPVPWRTVAEGISDVCVGVCVYIFVSMGRHQSVCVRSKFEATSGHTGIMTFLTVLYSWHWE